MSPAAPAHPMIMVVGPTAGGKTRLGVEIARRFGGEIVSFDSRQVYRGLDVGSGKDLAEFAATATAPAVPCHLIDVADPDEPFDLHRFLPLAQQAVRDIRGRGRLPVGVGGTTLYVKAFLENYDLPGGNPDPARRAELSALDAAELVRRLAALAPETAARLGEDAPRRRLVRALEIALSGGNAAAVTRPVLDLDPLLLAPYFPRLEMHARIAARLDARLQGGGLLEEVAALHRRGVGWERLDSFGLEYRFIARHLQGKLSFAAMRDQLLAGIRNLCKAQDIWYRKLEREGYVIHWIPGGDAALATERVRQFLAGEPLPPPEIRISEVFYGPKSGP